MFQIIKVIIAVILSGISLFLVVTSLSNTTEGYENFLKGSGSIPNDRYLQAKVIINGFELRVYLAVTNDQQIKGLSIKDMKFPIDIIWLDNNGTVVYVKNNLQPCTTIFAFLCPTYIPDKDSLYVLETSSGFSNKHSIKIGTHADFQLIR